MKDRLKRIVTNRKLIIISGAIFERNEKIVLNCDRLKCLVIDILFVLDYLDYKIWKSRNSRDKNEDEK